jgi:hypothetical protein
MTTLSVELPTVGLPDKTQDVRINTALTAIQTWGNGNVGTVNLETGLLAGSWEALVRGAKIEANATYQTPGSRKELGAASVRLRGVLAVKAGQKLEAGETLATLAVGQRPPATEGFTVFASGAAQALTITAAGVMTLSANVEAAQNVFLGGISFNLT